VEIKELSLACGIAALLAILVLPIVISALSFKVGFAVPELAEALIISAWTIFISAKLDWKAELISLGARESCK
jgi:hypothetical membrane protein